MVLGRMAARVQTTVKAGERCVVLAWRIGVEGKKQIAGSALVGASATVIDVANSICFDSPDAADEIP